MSYGLEVWGGNGNKVISITDRFQQRIAVFYLSVIPLDTWETLNTGINLSGGNIGIVVTNPTIQVIRSGATSLQWSRIPQTWAFPWATTPSIEIVRF